MHGQQRPEQEARNLKPIDYSQGYTPSTPLGIGGGDTLHVEYEVASVKFHSTHVSVLMLKDRNLKVGDAGYVGAPKAAKFTTDDPALVAEFQPGARVMMTLEVVKPPAAPGAPAQQAALPAGQAALPTGNITTPHGAQTLANAARHGADPNDPTVQAMAQSIADSLGVPADWAPGDEEAGAVGNTEGGGVHRTPPPSFRWQARKRCSV